MHFGLPNALSLSVKAGGGFVSTSVRPYIGRSAKFTAFYKVGGGEDYLPTGRVRNALCVSIAVLRGPGGFVLASERSYIDRSAKFTAFFKVGQKFSSFGPRFARSRWFRLASERPYSDRSAKFTTFF